MAATVVSNPPSAAVVLDGEIDISTCPAIRRFLMAAISGGDVHLAVDMSGVTFIDASGIGVLVAAANRARQAGGGLSLLAPSPQVRRLLDVLHLDAILPAAERLTGPSVPAAPPDASPGPAARTRDAVVSGRPRRSISHAFRSASATWLSQVSFRCGA
jgi:anti-anti-sigma factor